MAQPQAARPIPQNKRLGSFDPNTHKKALAQTQEEKKIREGEVDYWLLAIGFIPSTKVRGGG
jgi:hypothetical protein